jgi:hypothetical protein
MVGQKRNHDTRQAEYTSFLLRYWYEPEDQHWYGEIEHVQSGTRQPVTNVADVSAFLLANSRVQQLIDQLLQEK